MLLSIPSRNSTNENKEIRRQNSIRTKRTVEKTAIIKITGTEKIHERCQQSFGRWKMNGGFLIAEKAKYQNLQ